MMVAENSLEKILEVNYHINTQRKNKTPLNTVLLVNFLKGFFSFLISFEVFNFLQIQKVNLKRIHK